MRRVSAVSDSAVVDLCIVFFNASAVGKRDVFLLLITVRWQPWTWDRCAVKCDRVASCVHCRSTL